MSLEPIEEEEPKNAALDESRPIAEVVVMVILVCIVTGVRLMPTRAEFEAASACIDKPIVAKTTKDQCPTWLTTQFLRQAAVAEYHWYSPNWKCRKWSSNYDKTVETLVLFYLDSHRDMIRSWMSDDLRDQMEGILVQDYE